MTAAAAAAPDRAAPDRAGSVPARPGHLHAVDVVRLATVVGVIAVHTTSLTMPSSDVGAGAVLTLLHVTREVFVFLSAFVLAFSYRDRPLVRRTFWRRRYLLVVVPYVAWTVIYLLADGSLGSPVTLVVRLARDLVTGGARFHLYFLLVTFQLYAVFPWILAWVRRQRRPVAILVASATFQLAFTAAIHYRLPLSGPPAAWLTHPGSWLPSYQLYVVTGILAALHLDALTEWAGRHRRAIAWPVLSAAACGLLSYGLDVGLIGMTPIRASEVFQPVVTIESLAAIAALYVFGMWLTEGLSARRRHHLEVGSDLSFGVFLAHPLLLQGVLAAAGATGVATIVAHVPSPLRLALVVFGLVPVAYLTTAALIVLARRTPLSLALTGRPARASAPDRPRVLPVTAMVKSPMVKSPMVKSPPTCSPHRPEGVFQ